jgi:hypothetical protein
MPTKPAALQRDALPIAFLPRPLDASGSKWTPPDHSRTRTRRAVVQLKCEQISVIRGISDTTKFFRQKAKKMKAPSSDGAYETHYLHPRTQHKFIASTVTSSFALECSFRETNRQFWHVGSSSRKDPARSMMTRSHKQQFAHDI